jgi:hypothetical protein
MPATLADALHPKRFPGMSGRMAAVVGYILNEDWTKPPTTATTTIDADPGIGSKPNTTTF